MEAFCVREQLLPPEPVTTVLCYVESLKVGCAAYMVVMDNFHQAQKHMIQDPISVRRMLTVTLQLVPQQASGLTTLF